MSESTNIVWVDVETTGVEANTDHLLQVAMRITDTDLNFIDGAGFERKVHYSCEEVEKFRSTVVPFVVNMHEATGLWDALPTEGVSLAQIELEALEHILPYLPDAKNPRLAGNSITLDRNFINLNLPIFGSRLHYRSYDVSTLAGLVERWMGKEYLYPKEKTHEAMDDITESVKELRHYRDLLFPVLGKAVTETS